MEPSETRARVDKIIFSETLRRFTQDSPVLAEIHTLELIEASRGTDDEFRIHLTHRQGRERLGERLDAFLADRRAERYVFRDDDALSLKVDLATAVDY